MAWGFFSCCAAHVLVRGRRWPSDDDVEIPQVVLVRRGTDARGCTHKQGQQHHGLRRATGKEATARRRRRGGPGSTRGVTWRGTARVDARRGDAAARAWRCESHLVRSAGAESPLRSDGAAARRRSWWSREPMQQLRARGEGVVSAASQPWRGTRAAEAQLAALQGCSASQLYAPGSVAAVLVPVQDGIQAM